MNGRGKPMSNAEAAELLVEMVARLVKEGYSSEKYAAAAALACGYLLIDDVLDRRPQAIEAERHDS